MIVSNGTISGQIEALDPETLVPVWSNGIGEESFLYGAAENVVIASPGYGEIVGLDAGDGMRLWSVDLGETSVSRMRADGSGRWLATVNYGSEGDHRAPEMIAFDSLSGKVLWTTQAYAGTDWQPTPPSVIGEMVVALDVPTTAETASVHGFDLETGERLWSTPLASPLEVFPSTDMILTDSQRDLLLVMTTGGTLWRIDPADGSELWRTTTGVSEFIGLSPDTVTIRRANVEIEIDLETGMW